MVWQARHFNLPYFGLVTAIPVDGYDEFRKKFFYTNQRIKSDHDPYTHSNFPHAV